MLLERYAKRLAERLGGLPLALATAGAHIRNSNFTFERCLQEYERRWHVDPRRPLQLQECQDCTLYTTWDLSYTRLESEDPDAAQLLKLLAYFDNQSIWYELLNTGVADGSPKWLRKVTVDDVTFASVMRTLTDYCFVEVQKAAEQEATGSWSMHNCVNDWTLGGLSRDVDANQYWLRFDCVANQFGYEDWGHLSAIRYQRFTGHACRLVHNRFQQAANQDDSTLTRLEQIVYLAKLLSEQVQHNAAEQMYRRALAGKEKALGPEHTSTLSTVNNLVHLYVDQGKLAEAEQMYQRALANKERNLGPDRTTLDAINYLGALYCNQGRLTECIKLAIIWRESRSAHLFGGLGRMLLKHSDELNAKIAFQQVIGYEDDVMVHKNIQCDGCGFSITCTMTRFVCKDCPDGDLCRECLVKHKTGVTRVSTCSNHSFLEITPEKSSGMEPGCLMEETSRTLWLRDLMIQYPEKAA